MSISPSQRSERPECSLFATIAKAQDAGPRTGQELHISATFEAPMSLSAGRNIDPRHIPKAMSFRSLQECCLGSCVKPDTNLCNVSSSHCFAHVKLLWTLLHHICTTHAIYTKAARPWSFGPFCFRPSKLLRCTTEICTVTMSVLSVTHPTDPALDSI